MVGLRITEYIHWMNRDDIGIMQREKEWDYTHLTIIGRYKRHRYEFKKKQREVE